MLTEAGVRSPPLPELLEQVSQASSLLPAIQAHSVLEPQVPGFINLHRLSASPTRL